MQMNDIRFVYFDLGRVVVDNEASFALLSRKTGVSYERITEFFDRYWKAACLGKISSVDHLAIFKKGLKIRTDAPDFAEFWSAFHVQIKETVGLINDLKGRVKLGVLSNAEPGVFEKNMERDKIPNPPWDATVISCDVGYVKPDIRIYKIAQARAGVAPSQIFYTDDRQENIDVARVLGWQTQLFVKEDIPATMRRLRKALGLN